VEPRACASGVGISIRSVNIPSNSLLRNRVKNIGRLSIGQYLRRTLWNMGCFPCSPVASDFYQVVYSYILRHCHRSFRRPTTLADLSRNSRCLYGTACHMFNQIAAGVEWPKYLSSDNDPLFGYWRWRGEFKDRIIFWNEAEITDERHLASFDSKNFRLHDGKFRFH